MGVYGNQLTTIREELSKRKLEDISTEKLFGMELKLMAELRSIDQRIIFTDMKENDPFSVKKEVRWGIKRKMV